jgi:hypothetical protein
VSRRGQRRGWDLVEVHTDRGVSGAKAVRPALRTLLDAVGRGEVDAILVTKLDRLRRSQRNLVPLLAELEDGGAVDLMGRLSVVVSYSKQLGTQPCRKQSNTQPPTPLDTHCRLNTAKTGPSGATSNRSTPPQREKPAPKGRPNAIS